MRKSTLETDPSQSALLQENCCDALVEGVGKGPQLSYLNLDVSLVPTKGLLFLAYLPSAMHIHVSKWNIPCSSKGR